MPAIALHFQAEVDIIFFAGLHAEQKALAFLGFKVAGVSVDAVFGINQIALVRDEPLYAVGCAAFFVRGQGDDQSRAGVQPSFLRRRKLATSSVSPCLMSDVPRP